MRKLTLAFAFLLTASAAARAQDPYSGAPVRDPHRDALAIRDPVRREEALIAGARRTISRMEHEAASGRRSSRSGSGAYVGFKAEIEVTNRSAKTIKSVNWTATLTDPETGAVIDAYDVTTRASIAPGGKKKFSKRLKTPRAAVLNAARTQTGRAPVADLKVAVTGVTYADGSTAPTP